ncbi:MAG: TIGR02281 family clan AA aspartic protease [Gammaproteobacteria bacterium]|nr:MAG: TIGR02281 family clan AA aspartic protease [Gammaproteobacteria bacterium]
MTVRKGGDGDNIAGIARFMVLLSWAAGLAFAAYLFQHLLDERFNPNRDLSLEVTPGGPREVVLRRNAQGHYVADGAIDGHRVTFLVDTGATTVAMPEALARRWGLRLQPGGLSETANGTVQVWRTTLREVRLGAIRLHDVPAVVMPSMGPRSPVLLGMSFLQRLELIQRDGRLLLRQR